MYAHAIENSKDHIRFIVINGAFWKIKISPSLRHYANHVIDLLSSCINKDLSVAYCRLLAREGISADQLTRDLKSFELKVRFFSTRRTVLIFVGQCVHQ